VVKSKADAIGSTVARLLREKREALKLSTYIIGKRARISHSTLLRIENESRKPSLDTLLRIAEAMDMEIWPLIKEAERKVGLPQGKANSQ
jgi:transcriptional regulator with XRE-family HTH domain